MRVKIGAGNDIGPYPDTPQGSQGQPPPRLDRTSRLTHPPSRTIGGRPYPDYQEMVRRRPQLTGPNGHRVPDCPHPHRRGARRSSGPWRRPGPRLLGRPPARPQGPSPSCSPLMLTVVRVGGDVIVVQLPPDRGRLRGMLPLAGGAASGAGQAALRSRAASCSQCHETAVRYLRTHPGFFSMLGNGGVKGTQATPSQVYSLPVRVACAPSLCGARQALVGASGSGDAHRRRTPPLGGGSERVVKWVRPACFAGAAVRSSVMEEAARPSLVVDLPRCRVDLGTKVVTCRIDAATLRRRV